MNDLNFGGLLIGIATFLIIGLFHPVVVKAEYFFGTAIWWIFLAFGLIGTAISLVVSDMVISTLLGVFAFSCFWTIKELFEQEKRVERGWFPKNPKRNKTAKNPTKNKAENQSGNISE